MKHYAEVKAKPDFVELEKDILNFWEENKTFEKGDKDHEGTGKDLQSGGH